MKGPNKKRVGVIVHLKIMAIRRRYYWKCLVPLYRQLTLNSESVDTTVALAPRIQSANEIPQGYLDVTKNLIANPIPSLFHAEALLVFGVDLEDKPSVMTKERAPTHFHGMLRGLSRPRALNHRLTMPQTISPAIRIIAPTLL